MTVRMLEEKMISIGILTYHKAKNYGAFLQAYGLSQRLNEEKDINAEIIDFSMKREKKRYKVGNNPIYIVKNFKQWNHYKRLYNGFEKGYKKAPISKDRCVSDSIEDFDNFVKNKYDIIITGSDEVWSLKSFRGFPNPYWLPGEIKCKKVSYAAASSTSNFEKQPDDIKYKIIEYLNDFEYITVRDKNTYNQISTIANYNDRLEKMPDPSFVYDYKANGDKGRRILKEQFKISSNDKIAIVMTENVKLQKMIGNVIGNTHKIVSVYDYADGFNNLSDITPFEWLDVIAGADLVLASYFHAICFSVLNNRRFLAFGTDAKKDKLTEVLESVNLEKFFVDIEDISEAILSEKIQFCIDEEYDCHKEINEQRDKFIYFVDILRTIGEKNERKQH